jgi:hypothetical protein
MQKNEFETSSLFKAKCMGRKETSRKIEPRGKEWLANLLCIRVISGSNFDPKTSYLKALCVSFNQPRQIQRECLNSGHDLILPHLFQFVIIAQINTMKFTEGAIK